MSKRTVLTDGNGSDLIQVAGLGVYIPLEKYQQLEQQHAELVAQVEALKDWRRLALQFDGHRMQAMSLLKQVATANFSYDEVSAFVAAAPVSGNEHIRDIQAEAVLGAIKSCVIVDCFETPCISVRGLTQYAERVRTGAA